MCYLLNDYIEEKKSLVIRFLSIEWSVVVCGRLYIFLLGHGTGLNNDIASNSSSQTVYADIHLCQQQYRDFLQRKNGSRTNQTTTETRNVIKLIVDPIHITV